MIICHQHFLQKAEKSLKYYKGYTGKSIDEVLAFSAEFEKRKVIANKLKIDEKIMLKDICKWFKSTQCEQELIYARFFSFPVNRQSMKGLLNGITFACLVHLTASLVIVTYAVVIFKQVGVEHFDPYYSSITIAVMQIVGTLCTTQLSDSMGRKILLIISLLGSAFGLFAFSLYSYLKHNGHDLSAFEWLPVTSLSFVIFIASAGVVPLVFVVTVENLPTKVTCCLLPQSLQSTLISLCVWKYRFLHFHRLELLVWQYAMFSWISHRSFAWNYSQHLWSALDSMDACSFLVLRAFLARCTYSSWLKKQKAFQWMQFDRKIRLKITPTDRKRTISLFKSWLSEFLYITGED